MLVLRNLQLRRGVKVLFDDVNLTFNRGQKIGVTGANGRNAAREVIRDQNKYSKRIRSRLFNN